MRLGPGFLPPHGGAIRLGGCLRKACPEKGRWGQQNFYFGFELPAPPVGLEAAGVAGLVVIGVFDLEVAVLPALAGAEPEAGDGAPPLLVWDAPAAGLAGVAWLLGWGGGMGAGESALLLR